MRSVLARIISLALLLAALEAHAGGAALQLSSVRITVEPRERTGGVTLTNQSTEPQRYRVSIIDMVMDVNGRVSEPGEEKVPDVRSASQWVIATPATIRLAPGESQRIRLLIRRPGGLADGEYRAHLRVAQEPPADVTGGLRERVANDDGLQLNITTVHTMIIPIFVQQGRTYSTASIAEAHFIDAGKRVTLNLKRQGTSSFRGFVQATASNADALYMPCVIYPELEEMNVAYDLGTLANAARPLTLRLYAGTVPRPGDQPATEVLSSIRVPE